MERTIFLQHYRVCLGYDGTPNELGRDGDVIAYEGVDERSGEPVALTLVPVESIDPAVREQFEEQARAVQRLRHVNIAKVFDFGREAGNYVYVSERLSGETLDAWVGQHGPMPGDATLRVAEQITSVLSSASFHKLPYPAIEPSDIAIVPGQTPEGGWPLVKLHNFGLAGVTSPPKNPPQAEPSPSGAPGELEPKNTPVHGQAPSTARPVVAESPKPSGEHRMPDFSSEIYSLGATMYFLLTGVALSAGAVQQSVNFAGFPKPLRSLLGRMLHPNPDKRPKDLVTLAEMIRGCLLKIERRLALADKYGIPFRTTIRQPTEGRPRRLLRTALAVGALVLAAAVIAPLLFPVPLGGLLHQPREKKTIGVLVGVPESSPTPAVVQNPLPPTDPATVLSQAANPFTNQPATTSASPPNSSEPASPIPQPAEASNPQAQTVVTPPGPSGAVPEGSTESQTGESSAKPLEATKSATANLGASRSKKKRVASTSSSRERSVRVRMLGITSDGKLIYRLPSGRTRIVAPDSDEDNFVPRRRRRELIQRDELLAPPPQFGPDYFPYD
jgi:serine/threonine protein kinase